MGHGAGRQMRPIAEVGMSSATKVSRQPKKTFEISTVFCRCGGGMRENVGYPKLYSGYKEKEVNFDCEVSRNRIVEWFDI